MKSAISAKGQIVLPAELRRRDGIEPRQMFEIERTEQGSYRLERSDSSKNRRLADAFLACPEKDWFQPIPSESTRSMESRRRDVRLDADVLSELPQ